MNIELGELPEGAFRELNEEEIEGLRKELYGLP